MPPAVVLTHVNEFGLIWRLGLALLLSSIVGVEREMRQKSAELRTYALVGTGRRCSCWSARTASRTLWARTPHSIRRGSRRRSCRGSASSAVA
jgi:uncharacterized membrane protein YhiD involved in acid resistance